MKLDYIMDELDRIDEKGIEGMRQIAKKAKKAIGYGHMDTDGITSSIGFKKYLENYRIKTVDWHPIQYGGQEFSIPEPKKGYVNWIVDFAHTKGNKVDIWLDHHEGAHKGAGKKTSTKFASTKSNIADIQDSISIRDIFPPEDIEIINTVDSADFYNKGLTPEDIMRAAFNLDRSIDVKGNHERMGLVVNKLLLSYKNKPDFLRKLVLRANPSLISMYNVIRRLAKEEGYDPPEEIEKGQQRYNTQQAQDIAQIKKPEGIEVLDSGESAMLNGIVAQYGGGKMGMNKGMQFDRYTAFKNHPDAEYLIMGWPMGLIQVSENPFKEKTGADLLSLVFDKVLPKYEDRWKKQMLTLADLKKKFEEDVTKKNLEDAIGFTFDDLVNSFDNSQIKGIDITKSDKWTNIISDITNKKYKDLSDNQIDILSKIKVSAWDVITSQSGGHKAIANLTNLWALGKGYPYKIKEIMADVARELLKMKK